MLKNGVNLKRGIKALAVVFAIGYIFSFSQVQAATTIGANITTDGYLKLNTSSTTPAGINGTIYFDGTKFKCYQEGVWSNCIGGVSGTLPVSGGGTGLTTIPAGAMLYAAGLDTLASLTIGTSGQILTSNGSAPVWTNADPLVLTNTYVHDYKDHITDPNRCTNETNALVGDVCIALVDNITYILQYSPYTTASNWKELIADKSQYLLKASNLSDVANVALAQTNLGLGTANSPTFNGLNLNTGATISGAGALTLDSAAALNLGNTNATSISLGRSGIDITVNGDFNIADYIDFNTISNPGPFEGRLYYDTDLKSLSYFNDQIAVDIGQKNILRVENNSGDDILYGQIVYISGAGTGGIPAVDLALADDASTSKVLGFAAEDIAVGSQGYVTAYGMLKRLDTSAYTDGDPVYLSATVPGGMTQIKPIQPKYEVPVGYIGDATAFPNGTLLVFVVPKLSTIVNTGGISYGNAEGYLVDDYANLFWDDTNKRLGIGTNTPAYTLDINNSIKADTGIFYLSTSAGAPAVTAVNGAMYYDTSSDIFKCYENSDWKNCDTTGGTTTLQTAYDNGAIITTAGSTDIAYTLTSGNLTASGAGSVNLSPTNASSFTSGGALTLTAGATSVWSTTAGDLTINSGPASALTLDSGTTGAVNIGNNANAKTITIGNTTGATSLVLSSGSAGISLNTSGGANLMPYGLASGNTTEQRFLELAGTGTNYVGFKAPDSIVANKIWTLPSADGSSGEFLSTDGLGVLSWSTAAGGGGTLQSAYDNGATITTAASTDIALTLTSGDFTASGAGSVKLSPAGGVSLPPYGTGVGNTTEQRFLELAANGTNYVGFKAPDNIDNITGSEIWTLPGIDGSNGQVLTTDGGGLLSWSTASGVGSVALSAITAATGGNSINNVDNAQAWNWSLTNPAKTAFSFNENVASINGAGSQYILSVGTLATSTAAPLKVTAGGNTIINTTSTGGVTIGNSTAAQPVTIDAGTAALSFGNSNNTKTINIGTGTAVDTINIGNGATGADLITIGSANAGASSFASGAALTLTGGAASVWSTTAGNLTLQAGSGTVSLGTSTNLTANGALEITSGTATALTINSGTTGNLLIGTDASPETINIGTGTAAKTLTLGSTNTTSTTNIQSGTGNIKLEVAGSGITGNIQIGGTAGATPDLLVLDTKNTAGDPGTPPDGAMYYNSAESGGIFKCRKAGTWVNCDTTGATSLQTAYNGGNTITTSSNNAITFTAPGGSTNAGLIINQGNASANALEISTTGTGYDVRGTGSSWTITKNGVISTTGNINATVTGAITSAGTLTASNGLTLSSGALSLTSTSGSISSTGLTGLTLTLASGIGAITAPTLNLNTTGTGNTSIGNATGTFALNSSALDITTGGVMTGGTWNGTAIAAAYGGTGLTSYTIGDLIYASGATTLSKLPDVAIGSCLISQGVGVAPIWGACSAGSMTNPMTTIGDIIYGGASGTPTRLPAGTSGQFLRSNGATAPTWSSPVLVKRTTVDRCVGVQVGPVTCPFSGATATPVSDPDMFIPIGANETWQVEGYALVTNANATPDVKIAFTIPTGATMSIGSLASPASATNVNYPDYFIVSGTASGLIAVAAADYTVIHFKGMVVNGANAGNIQFQWSQFISDATAGRQTILMANSYISGTLVP